jgi:hypothetical protein
MPDRVEERVKGRVKGELGSGPLSGLSSSTSAARTSPAHQGGEMVVGMTKDHTLKRRLT